MTEYPEGIPGILYLIEKESYIQALDYLNQGLVIHFILLFYK